MFSLPTLTLCRECGSAAISVEVAAMVYLNSLVPVSGQVAGKLRRNDYYFCDSCQDECHTKELMVGDRVYDDASKVEGEIVQIDLDSLTVKEGEAVVHILKYPLPGLIEIPEHRSLE